MTESALGRDRKGGWKERAGEGESQRGKTEPFPVGNLPDRRRTARSKLVPDRLSRGRFTPTRALCAPEALPCGAWPWMPPPPPPGNCTELLGLKLCCPLPETLRPFQTRAPHCPVALGPASGAAPQSRLRPPRSQPVNEPAPPAAPEVGGLRGAVTSNPRIFLIVMQ